MYRRITLPETNLKLTASLHVKMDGWKTLSDFRVSVYFFHGQTVDFREDQVRFI